MSYEDGLVHRVSVLALVAATRDPRQRPTAEFEAVPGLESVPCRLTTPSGREVDQFARRSMVISHKVLLPGGTRLTNRNRLVFADPVTSAPLTLHVHAAGDPHQLGRWYLAWCEEVAT